MAVNRAEKEDIKTPSKGVEVKDIIEAMRGLEELLFCPKCNKLFECRYKACPKCGEPNQKYKLFNNEDQVRAEEKVVSTIREFNKLRKIL